MTDKIEDGAVYAFAQRALACGISVIPIDSDGSKTSTLSSWGTYIDERATADALRFWFERWPSRGVAVVCGAISGNLECLDFDDRTAFVEWRELVIRAGYDELLAHIEGGYLEHSPRGVHILYRCEEIAGATKLAFASKKAIIETRGEGNYVITAPSCGPVHETGRPYELIKGTIESVRTISAEDRRALHDIARVMDESGHERATVHESKSAPATDAGRPGDDWARHHTWSDILEPHGWTRLHTQGDVTFWRRPGKTRGISATTNYAGAGYLHIFTTSTEFEAGRSYGKFGAFALLEHSSDFKAAAMELRSGGYGEPSTSGVDLSGLQSPQSVRQKPVEPTTMLSSGGTFNELHHALTDQVPKARYLLRDTRSDHGGGSIELGTVTMIAAEGGAGKTSLLLQLAMAVGHGGSWMDNYECDAPQDVMCLFAEEDMRRLRERLGATADLLNLSHNDRAHFHDRVFLWSGADHPSPSLFAVDNRTVKPTAFFRELVDLVAVRKPKLLIIDPLASFASVTETDAESAAQAMGFLRGLAKEHNVALYLAHHTRKPAAGVPVTQHDARGSSAITNACREQHGLTKAEDGSGCTFEVTKFNNGRWGPSTQLPLVFDELHGFMPRPRMSHEVLETEMAKAENAARKAERADALQVAKHEAGMAKARERILAEIERAPGRTTSVIKACVPGTQSIVRAAVSELKSNGEIDVVSGPRGSEFLHPKGSQTAP